MGYLKVAEEYQIAFEQGNLERAKELLLAHHESWTYIQVRYRVLLKQDIKKTMPGCMERLLRQKEFLDNIVLEAEKTQTDT